MSEGAEFFNGVHVKWSGVTGEVVICTLVV